MPVETREKAVVHVIDDDASMRRALEEVFNSVGLETRTYSTASDFLAAKLMDGPGCVVVDVRLPDMNGLDFQTHLTRMGISLPVVIMTGYGDIPMSVRAMKIGIVELSTAPLPRFDSGSTNCPPANNRSCFWLRPER